MVLVKVAGILALYQTALKLIRRLYRKPNFVLAWVNAAAGREHADSDIWLWLIAQLIDSESFFFLFTHSISVAVLHSDAA